MNDVMERSVEYVNFDARTWITRLQLALGWFVLLSLAGVAIWFNSHEQSVLESHGNWRFSESAYHRLDLNLRHLTFNGFFYVVSGFGFFLPLFLSFLSFATARKEPIQPELIWSFVLMVTSVACWVWLGSSISDLADFLE